MLPDIFGRNQIFCETRWHSWNLKWQSIWKLFLIPVGFVAVFVACFPWNMELILLCDESSTIVNERERRGMHKKEECSFQSLLGLWGDLIRQRFPGEHSLCSSFHWCAGKLCRCYRKFWTLNKVLQFLTNGNLETYVMLQFIRFSTTIKI